jgi:mediator of RNA polymerase II transcription subunit 14
MLFLPIIVSISILTLSYRHALDFRLMNDQNIAILDSSHSLFDVQTPGKTVTKDPVVDDLVLQPIPQMRDIVTDAVQNGLASGQLTMGKVAAIDIGVVCDASGVGPLTKAIHTRILEQLKT